MIMISSAHDGCVDRLVVQRSPAALVTLIHELRQARQLLLKRSTAQADIPESRHPGCFAKDMQCPVPQLVCLSRCSPGKHPAPFPSDAQVKHVALHLAATPGAAGMPAMQERAISKKCTHIKRVVLFLVQCTRCTWLKHCKQRERHMMHDSHTVRHSRCPRTGC
jgi:hypothetical protein